MIRVMIIDDEPRLLRAWTAIIREQPGMELVDARSRADGLLAAVEAARPDVVVIDLTMPGEDPLVAIRDMAAAHPSARALAYTGQTDPLLIQEAFNAGVWGYVDKLASPPAMLDAIARVARGEVVLPPGFDRS